MPLIRRRPSVARMFGAQAPAPRCLAGLMLASLMLFAATLCQTTVSAEPDWARVAGRTRAQWRTAAASQTPEVRRQAAAALAQFGPTAIDELALLVSDPDAAVRIWALRGLKRGRTAVSPETSTPAPQDSGVANASPPARSWSEEQVRRAAELATARLDDPNVSVRIAAAVTLASHGRLEPALKELTTDLTSPIPGARIEAITELKSLGSAARPALDAIRAADDAPNSGDYVTRLRDRLLQELATSKDTP